MFKKLYLFSLLAALSFVTCKKDGDHSKVQNPPCTLLQQSFFHPNTTSSKWSNLAYHADGSIEEIQRIEQAPEYFTNGQGPFQSPPDTTYMHFEYENGKVIKTTTSDFGYGRFTEYEYTGDLLTRSIDYFDIGVIEGYHLFKYDTLGHLIERLDSTTQVNYKHIFEYDGDNLSSIETFNLSSLPQKKTKTIYSNFDDKQNFALAVHGLPASFVQIFHSASPTSPNNYQLEEYHFPIPINEDYNHWVTSDHSYEYNEDGFPTKMYYDGWEVSFEYECQ